MYTGQKLAVDIGNNSIKMLFGKNKKIFHAVSIKTPDKSFEDNIISDGEKIYSAINNHIVDNKLKVSSISFCIHGQDVVIRHIEIPIMDKRKLKEAVEWETNQYLPEGGVNYYIDYEIIDRINTNEKKVYKLLVVAILKEKVEQYVKLSEKLELKLKAIDISANCTARVFSNRGVVKKNIKSIGIIDFGSKFSSITIMSNGKLLMEREIPFGIDNIIKEVSKGQQISMEDAARYFIGKFDFDKMDLESELDKRIQELFQNVISTFQRVIEFYSAGKVEKNLDEIFLIGGGSEIKGIQNYFRGYLSSPVNLAVNPEGLGRKLYYPGDAGFCLYINTLGLLLRKE